MSRDEEQRPQALDPQGFAPSVKRAFDARLAKSRGVSESAPVIDRREERIPDRAWAEMCEAIDQFTREARDGGMEPEEVIVEIKKILSASVPGLPHWSPLRSAVIRRCIHAYFPLRATDEDSAT
jgi:hypothetical protein